MDCQREDVEFLSHNIVCRAWLYKPVITADEDRPCIVMAHGLGGTRDAGLEPYALKFANAGYMVLIFDYRHFGASDGEPRQLCSVKRQLQDWASATNYVRSLQGVDPEKIALWGFSLSGGHAIVTAVRDGRIAAVSVQAPVLDTYAIIGCFFRAAGPINFIKSFAVGVVDLLGGILGMSPIYVPIFGSPHDLAPLCSKEDARDYDTITPEKWRNEICARYGLLFKGYRAIAYVNRLPCSALIQVAIQDKVTPSAPALKAAQKIGTKAELKQYDCGHINICLDENFNHTSNDQLAFFSRAFREKTA